MSKNFQNTVWPWNCKIKKTRKPRQIAVVTQKKTGPYCQCTPRYINVTRNCWEIVKRLFDHTSVNEGTRKSHQIARANSVTQKKAGPHCLSTPRYINVTRNCQKMVKTLFDHTSVNESTRKSRQIACANSLTQKKKQDLIAYVHQDILT